MSTGPSTVRCSILNRCRSRANATMRSRLLDPVVNRRSAHDDALCDAECGQQSLGAALCVKRVVA